MPGRLVQCLVLLGAFAMMTEAQTRVLLTQEGGVRSTLTGAAQGTNTFTIPAGSVCSKPSLRLTMKNLDNNGITKAIKFQLNAQLLDMGMCIPGSFQTCSGSWFTCTDVGQSTWSLTPFNRLGKQSLSAGDSFQLHIKVPSTVTACTTTVGGIEYRFYGKVELLCESLPPPTPQPVAAPGPAPQPAPGPGAPAPGSAPGPAPATAPVGGSAPSPGSAPGGSPASITAATSATSSTASDPSGTVIVAMIFGVFAFLVACFVCVCGGCLYYQKFGMAMPPQGWADAKLLPTKTETDEVGMANLQIEAGQETV